MIRNISSVLEGKVITNSDNRIVFQVEDVGEFAVHTFDIEKHQFKQTKKDKFLVDAKGLCFLYQDSFEGMAGYVYPANLQIVNEPG